MKKCAAVHILFKYYFFTVEMLSVKGTIYRSTSHYFSTPDHKRILIHTYTYVHTFLAYHSDRGTWACHKCTKIFITETVGGHKIAAQLVLRVSSIDHLIYSNIQSKRWYDTLYTVYIYIYI